MDYLYGNYLEERMKNDGMGGERIEEKSSLSESNLLDKAFWENDESGGIDNDREINEEGNFNLGEIIEEAEIGEETPFVQNPIFLTEPLLSFSFYRMYLSIDQIEETVMRLSHAFSSKNEEDKNSLKNKYFEKITSPYSKHITRQGFFSLVLELFPSEYKLDEEICTLVYCYYSHSLIDCTGLLSMKRFLDMIQQG